VGARVAFIDLPWADSYVRCRLALADDARHDTGEESAAAARDAGRAGARTSSPRSRLHVGREDPQRGVGRVLRDRPGALIPTTYLVARAHALGERGAAVGGARGRTGDRAREAFMARRIAETLADTAGPVLVVTGAFHTAGLQALLAGRIPPSPGPAPIALPGLVAGTALVPTSYETLDAHRGYLAGQPSPGFYHRVFEATPTREASTVSDLFTEAGRRAACPPRGGLARGRDRRDDHGEGARPDAGPCPAVARRPGRRHHRRRRQG
jgi:hypothetical protein